ncbi:MAG TPA: class I SAM-dependent methyltransferase, partial [Solirubrobacterales bacterium]|nr:class I SAM-dependent methyltransferase [Solirubrobacterales bacterium]
MADPARAYAETPYPTGLCLPGHPDLLAACARLHGLEPADPDGCRYLDLACGDGTNALAVADSLPGSECLGIDIASSAIERGESLRRELGLGNAELRAADLLEAEVEPASWDYVVIHGLLSWVPEPVRRSTLALASRAVAPGGVVMASYSALPGWWMLRPARALARRHAAGAGPDPADRAAAARAAVRRASEIDDTGEAYAAMMDEAVERYESMTDSVLCHDDLA